MGRCKQCDSCISVIEFRKNNKGKKNRKILDQFEYANPCESPTSKRARLSETELLLSAGCGGRVKGEVRPIPTPDEITLQRVERQSRPKHSMIEDSVFDQDAFDEYLDLIDMCTKEADQTTSTDVKAEAPSMIRKMRGLLDPSLRDEVDYSEAVKDSSNVLVQWSHGYAAGRRAFIPDLTDRDLCYAALKIFSCAEDEAKLIPKEFVEMFGDEDGVGIYNQVILLIGEEDKQCLPLVNLCLRAWMRMLSRDVNLWADLTHLDFDRGVEAELARAKECGFSGKTSYEMLMAVFGEKSQSTLDVKKPRSTPRQMTLTFSKPNQKSSQVRKNMPSRQLSLVKKPPPPKDCTASEPNEKPSHIRKSKLKLLGEAVRKSFHNSNVLRSQYGYTTQANEVISAALKDHSEGEPNEWVLRSCRDAARRMEDILFSVGGVERLVATLRYFKDRPAVRELGVARELMITDSDNSDKDLNIYFSKREKLNETIVSGLKDFLSMFRRQRNENDKGGGRRKEEDQNAYDAVMAALVSGDLTAKKLRRILARTLNVSHRQIKRAESIRRNMEDMDKKGWIRKKSAVPKNAIGLEHRIAISDFMHSNDCSRVDNTDKVPVIVDLGICPETGARIYDLHERRELLFDDNEILDELTGRNRFDPSKPHGAHPTWDRVVQSTTTETRPKGIKGSTKLIRQCKCPCMKKMKASVCSCSICERFKSALHVFNKHQVSWRHQAIQKRKLKLIETLKSQKMTESEIKQYLDDNKEMLQCQMCNGICHPKKTWQTFAASPSTCMSALLCDQVHVPALDLPQLDINLREDGKMNEFKIYPEECCYGVHCRLARRGSVGTLREVPVCGWDAVFSEMPLHERCEKDPTTGEEITHRIHACPDEYSRDGTVTWMDFIKVARTSESKVDDDDEDYAGDSGVKFQTEWLPVEGTVPEFFAHLIRSMEAYFPHVYELKLSNRVDKCAERAFIIDPATKDDCPEEFKGVVSEVVDFASDIHAKRDHDLTCSFPETHKCEVHHVTFGAKMVSVEEIEKDHPRAAKRMRNKGVDRVLRPENVVFYCFSKAKASAAYNQQATTNIMSIIKYGVLPENSKCEAFLERKRICGGDRAGFPQLPEDKLSEWEGPVPLYPDVKRWRRSRDGCAAQYQGKGAFRGWQTMQARHGIICEDRRKISMHGKDVADGDGSAVSHMVKNSFQDNYGGGTQNLVRHLASKYPRPNIERRTRYAGEKGIYASSQYVYMSLEEDGMDNKIVATAKGYSGSRKDHYYRSMGVTEEFSRLVRRERACGCRSCLRLLTTCTLTPANAAMKAGTTPKETSVTLAPARLSPEARHTRNARNPLPEFCRGLAVGKNIIVRVSEAEKDDNPDEDYFVARIEEKAIQLEEDGLYSAVLYKKHDWIIFVRWYNFVPSYSNSRGDRGYTKGSPQWIPCGSIIKNITEPVTLKWSGKYFRMSKALHTHIEDHGDIIL